MTKDASIALSLTEKELSFILNAINEVRNGIEIEEFSTRLGFTEEQASQVHQKLKSIYSNRDK